MTLPDALKRLLARLAANFQQEVRPDRRKRLELREMPCGVTYVPRERNRP